MLRRKQTHLLEPYILIEEESFTSQEFNNFYEVNGIRRQLTTAWN